MRRTSEDAWSAFRILLTNPVGGMQRAFEAFEEGRALGVGIAFGVFFALCLTISLIISVNRYMGAFAQVDAETVMKVFFGGLVPLVAIAAAGFLARSIFRGTGTLAGDAFIAGASLLPLCVLILGAAILGVTNLEVTGIIGVFAICYSLLMLYNGFLTISQLPAAFAAAAVPITILISLWVMKIIGAGALENRLPGMF